MITASIVTYHNSFEDLEAVINSFLNTDLDVKLYISDNSSDKEIESLCKDKRIEYIYNNKLIETQGKLIDQFEKRTNELEELIYNLKKGKKPNISHQYVSESPEKLEEKRKT